MQLHTGGGSDLLIKYFIAVFLYYKMSLTLILTNYVLVLTDRQYCY